MVNIHNKPKPYRLLRIRFCHFIVAFIILGRAASSVAQDQVILPDKIHVKVDQSLASQLSNYADPSSPTGFRAFDVLNQQWDVKQINRIFPDAGKHEAAHRAHGLHLWYEVHFADSIGHDLTQVLQHYQRLDAIQLAEPVYQMSIEVIPQPTEVAPDPDFNDQWHYENTGQSGGTAGADISLTDAWKVETGSDDVVVAIIDGGMDPTHDDLAEAMWINQPEADGETGVDDDNNGYVDDIHGYGFGDGRGDFYPHYHGVHVGGTVGAVSNNGVGVAGIAGGSGTGDGVRLMSCAVFGSRSQGGFPTAFVYAADNGAVIAQNSWGGGRQSKVLEDAIDYFIARAGYDNTEENFDKNIQIGPMAGGLVVFAAGNSNSENPGSGYPASYSPTLAVASTDHNDQRSYFSNYGDWIEIAAPGSNVFSTYTNNTYNHLSGTSMACPHVSGVAALIVSQYGGEGFEPESVKSMLLRSADNIDTANPGYQGKLGAGRLNAFRALDLDDANQAPAPITDLIVDSLTHRSATLRWTATGNDGDEGAAARYDLRYAANPITADNFEQATPVADVSAPAPAGDTEYVEVTGLPADTKLYFALIAYDYHQLSSGMSNVAEGTTQEAPVMKLNPVSFTVNLNSGDSLTQQLTVDNTEGGSPLIVSLNTQSKQEVEDYSKKNSNWKILLIRTSKIYTKDAEDLLKEEYGITPDIINHYGLPDYDLSSYGLLVIASQNSSSFYRTISSQKAKFEAFSRRGGVIIYQSGNYTTSLPDGVQTNYVYDNSYKSSKSSGAYHHPEHSR